MILTLPPVTRFELGACFATANALARCSSEELLDHLRRHSSGDWGQLDEPDQLSNDLALDRGEGRVFSRYRLPRGDLLWIITEADRSATTIMLPEDY